MEISSCCGICSLKTGTIVIGILNLIFKVLALIVMILLCVTAISAYPIEVTSIGGGIISYMLMSLILTLLLIIGAAKRNVNYVFPFVYFDFGNILLSIGGCITLIIFFCVGSLPGFVIFLILFSFGVELSLHIYFWLIIYFFYKELMTEQYELNTHPNSYHQNDRSPLRSTQFEEE